ncbi:MAG TPA: hypothetical protein VFX13_11710 [Gaiellales bacterium]|nr:hypothetical protein [Gaiellales bacterium]
MANRKQQKRKYQRAVGRGRVFGDQEGRPETSAKSSGSSPGPRRRGEPQQPSAMRAAKRAAIFAVLFYVAISYTSLGGNMTDVVKAFNAVVMFVLFWSIGTITETFAWRRWQKKHGGSG